MPTKVIMPHMGESVVEGTILSWLKKVGDPVAQDEPLVEIETDKVNVELPSPAKGVLLQILASEGETVQIDSAIALIAEPGEKVETAPAIPAPTKAKPPSLPPAPKPARGEKPTPPAPQPKPSRAPSEPAPAAGPLGVLASPAVRRLARELGVDLSQVTGSGRMGRITREDVLAHTSAPAEAASAPAPSAEAHPATPGPDEELVPLTPMRRAIAEHMVKSSREAPHVTTVAEVDVTEVHRLREERRDAFSREGVKLTYMAFILAAVAGALREYPDLNSSWTPEGILVKRRINLGLAVSVEDGLIVPVIHNADRLSLLDLARAIQSAAEKARGRKVFPKDLEGGTFTITNPGVFGAVISTPIIHQPQAAILATGRIADVPAVIDGGIAVRKRMFLSLSYDHRVVDGATASRFLQKVREILEKADFPSS